MLVALVVFCLLRIRYSIGELRCIHCGQNFKGKMVVDCTISSLSNSTYILVCDDPGCPSVAPPDEAPDACFYALGIGEDGWVYETTFLKLGSGESSSMYCSTSLSVDAATLDAALNGTSFPFIYINSYCHCSANDCNKLGNLTMTLTISPSTVAEVDSSVSQLRTGGVMDQSSRIITASHSEGVSSTFISPSSVPSTSTTSSTNSVVVGSIQDDNVTVFVSVISVLVFAVVVIFSALLFTVCFFMYSKHISKRSQHSIRIHTPPPLYDMDFSSSITILNTIGYGKFGSVFKGIYEGYPVAVKVFSSHHFNSWKNEKTIYTLDSTPHDNILRFIAHEQRGTGRRQKLYMITEYHALGSLSHFLQHNKLTWSQTLKMVHSVSCGLAHLHSHSYINREGFVERKSAIAHRDVKSANVLVKDASGHCVLGDLGLALILDPDFDDRQMANSGQVGTYRYMAPEALDARVNLRDIESFKQIDVYALALVLWEVCTRCELGDNLVIPPYQSPYSNLVGERPSLELMKRVVVIEKSRPDIVGIWESHPELKQVVGIMEESWDEDPEARLTAANIVSRLESLERAQKKELAKEFSSTSSLSHNAPYTPVSEPRIHNKVRVSSSFSGQPRNHPVIQRMRLSVGSTEAPHNYIQRYHRRGSLTQHFELTENSDATKGHCSAQFLSNISDCTATAPPTGSSAVHQDVNINEVPPLNVDAATGQPNAALTNSNPSTDSSHDSDVDNDQ